MTARLLCVFCGGNEEISGVCRVCLDKAKARIEASRPTLSSPVLQARDIILECLLYRKGTLLTEMVARERANNIASALMELLEPRGNVVVHGEITTPERWLLEPGATPLMPGDDGPVFAPDRDLEDTAIGTVRAPANTNGGSDDA